MTQLSGLPNYPRPKGPLGGPGDREALIGALADGLISAVAIHHQALDARPRGHHRADRDR